MGDRDAATGRDRPRRIFCRYESSFFYLGRFLPRRRQSNVLKFFCKGLIHSERSEPAPPQPAGETVRERERECQNGITGERERERENARKSEMEKWDYVHNFSILWMTVSGEYRHPVPVSPDTVIQYYHPVPDRYWKHPVPHPNFPLIRYPSSRTG